MDISFVDLHAQYVSIKSEIDTAIKNVIEKSSFIGGEPVQKFERSFANLYGAKHCISVGNGTDAIYITLKMLGIGPGDQVITTALSWISTSEVITQVGATVVFADIEPDTYTIDPVDVRNKITSKTRAIIPVHLYGQAANMDQIMKIADEHDLMVVEDCAQAHFANYAGKHVGTFGNAATFSFFPGKNLGAYGDAGCIITDDDELAEKVRMYANHGALIKHRHVIEGVNSRMDGIQAAILSVKLKYIDSWTQMRIKNAEYYSNILKDLSGVIVPKIRQNSKHVFHLYVVQVENRAEVITNFNNHGVKYGIHYPTALPFLPAYSYLNHRAEDFVSSSSLTKKIISLPMYPELSEREMDYICGLLE